MWGIHGQKLAQVKALYVYMMLHPGKKLNFMGNELGEYKEWDEKDHLGWNILKYPIMMHSIISLKNSMKFMLKSSGLYQMDYGLKDLNGCS